MPKTTKARAAKTRAAKTRTAKARDKIAAMKEVPKEINLYRNRFRNFLKKEVCLNGKLMAKELLYRFAMVQFRDTHGFESGKIEYIPKVFEEMQHEFGNLFEEFANFCFNNGFDETFINFTIKKWLKSFSQKMEAE